MLKIKDGIDIRELGKFGFKPKFNEDTGYVKEWYLYTEEKINNNVFITKISFYPYSKPSKFFFLRNKKNYWALDDIDWIRKDVPDILYDLITAGLVEKC